MNGVEQLCSKCGLCCDSTLFADVELRAGEDAKRLKQLGLTLEPKTKSRQAFAQPCACFNGKLCGIYGERPTQCRKFKCGLFKRVDAGEMTPGAALKKIAAAKLRVEKVRGLLRQAGQRSESMALSHRYAEAMSAPIDLAAENSADLRGELMLAVSDLMQLLQRDFLR